MNDLENHPYYYYYQIGEQKFSTKLFALYAKEKSQNKHIIWNFPNWENELSKIDITKEPQESLQDLYLQRAIQLRNQYDYLVLYYSGGDDSNQILETFMLNNIFLDEIVIFIKYDKKVKDEIDNDLKVSMIFPEYYEAERSGIPQAKFYVETFSPRTKITIIDNIHSLNHKFWQSFDNNNLKDHLKSCNIGINYRILPRSKNLNFINPNWESLLSNKKVGHIFGKEKVRLSYDDKGFFIYMNDVNVIEYIDLAWLISNHNLPNNMELFYTHANFVKIHVKQAHEIIKKISKDKISSKNNPVFLTREIEDMFADVVYIRKYKRLYTDLKPADYIKIMIKDKSLSKEDLLNIRKYEMSEMATKFYLEQDEKDKTSNYYKLTNLVQSSFFPKINSSNIVDLFLTTISTKKYYIKEHVS